MCIGSVQVVEAETEHVYGFRFSTQISEAWVPVQPWDVFVAVTRSAVTVRDLPL